MLRDVRYLTVFPTPKKKDSHSTDNWELDDFFFRNLRWLIIIPNGMILN
jgi:hypothetical protein